VRDVVEIGMGREARRAYDLGQVEIVPSRRTRSSQEVSTAWRLDAYSFGIPLVTHPTDAVVSPASAVAVGKLGGLAVLNAEGLWARHADASDAPGRGLYWTSSVAHPSLPRSEVSGFAAGDRDLETVLFGPSTSPYGTVNLFGALRRAMAKTGYSDLKEFQRVGLTVRG
jgi:hypothetical protein